MTLSRKTAITASSSPANFFQFYMDYENILFFPRSIELSYKRKFRIFGGGSN